MRLQTVLESFYDLQERPGAANLGYHLVLASNSPRRKQLFALGGWMFRVAAAEVDEQVLPGEDARVYVVRLAMEKALAVASQAQPDEVIVAADTTVVDGATILGKPGDAAEATQMLQQLRGRTHQVYTGIAVLRTTDGLLMRDVCRTDVSMRDYSDQEIEAYVSSGDPRDKAGAYAIQHREFNPARPLQGCYANVMGLPLCHLARTLREAGVLPEEDISAACQSFLEYACPVYESILMA